MPHKISKSMAVSASREIEVAELELLQPPFQIAHQRFPADFDNSAAQPLCAGSGAPALVDVALKINTETKNGTMKSLGVFPRVSYRPVEDLLIHGTGELIV